jgi:hypothetical protein
VSRQAEPHQPEATSKQACPRCGAHTVARILYGLPNFDAKLEDALKAGRIVLGGCIVTGNDPDRTCTTCGHLFYRDGRAPEQPQW